MALELPLDMPRTVVLKNMYNGKYMRYTHEDAKHGLLQFTGDEALSPFAKFHVELAKASKDLVHIRCAYSNKYWRRWKPDNHWIAAAAEAPEEDTSKWSCTLFRPVRYVSPHGGPGVTARFLHVQLNHYACLFNDPASPYGNFLIAGWKDPNTQRMDVCVVVDRESLVALPQRLAFKDPNGLYLRGAPDSWSKAILHVFQAKDIADPNAGFQAFPTADGAFRIKSNINNRFWRAIAHRPPNFAYTIWADSNSETSTDADTVFWPVQVGDNVIALRSQANSKFCVPNSYVPHQLYAAASTLTQETRIQVEEHVQSREIYDVVFRLKDARIYGQNITVAATADTTNGGPNPISHKFRLKYVETKSSLWQRNVGLKFGVKTTLQTGIPFLAKGQIEISAETSTTTTWGDTNTTSTELESEYTAQVSPHSKMYVTLVATRGTCDVPFSYTQRDVLFDGRPVITDKDDGLYTGANSYNYQYETWEEPLPAAIDPHLSSDLTD